MTFDEDQVRRDGSGKFAEKGPAAEAGGVDLSGEHGPDAALVTAHAGSVATYDTQIAELEQQVSAARASRSRHVLAGLAVTNPDATYVEVGQHSGDDGSSMFGVEKVYTFDDEGTGSWSRDTGSWGGVELPGNQRDAWSDFELGSSGGDNRVLDLSRVRTWAADNSTPVSKSTLDWQASDAADRKVEHSHLKDMSDTTRERYPTARYIEVTESDSDWMSYSKVTDAEGKVLHSDDPDEVELAEGASLPDDHDEFTDTMNESAMSLDCRGGHWTDGAADDPEALPGAYETKKVDRDRHTGDVRSATLDLDRIDAL